MVRRTPKQTRTDAETFSIPTITDYTAGDTLEINFVIENFDESFGQKDLTGAEIDWSLHPRSQYFDAVLSLDDDDGVTVQNRIDSEGAFEIHVNAETTAELRGRYTQVLSVTDVDGQKDTMSGFIFVTAVGANERVPL